MLAQARALKGQDQDAYDAYEKALDHTGRVTARLAPFTQGVLNATVQGRTGLTPFAQWAQRFGLWPLLLLAAVIVATCAFVPRPRAAGPRPAG